MESLLHASSQVWLFLGFPAEILALGFNSFYKQTCPFPYTAESMIHVWCSQPARFSYLFLQGYGIL